jgi:hypothetical protein
LKKPLAILDSISLASSIKNLRKNTKPKCTTIKNQTPKCKMKNENAKCKL